MATYSFPPNDNESDINLWSLDKCSDVFANFRLTSETQATADDPVCGDTGGHLSITLMRDGMTRYHCFRCGSKDEWFAELREWATTPDSREETWAKKITSPEKQT